jgi:hypothetical protein
MIVSGTLPPNDAHYASISRCTNQNAATKFEISMTANFMRPRRNEAMCGTFAVTWGYTSPIPDWRRIDEKSQT